MFFWTHVEGKDLLFWVENYDFDSRSELGFENCQVDIEYLDQV